jgi:endonuclease G
MAFNGYLTNPEIDELTKAALESGLLAVPRQTLLAGIPPGFAAALPLAPNPLDQFVLDLVEVNRVQRMAGGEVPVLTLLENAAARLRLQDRAEARVFERILSRAGNVAAGVPPMPEPAQLPEVVNHERIIGTDDMVGIGFLAGGLKVALAVALISVPRYEQGQQVTVGGGPWVAKGTAWLMAPDFAITNHHVINAGRLGAPGRERGALVRLRHPRGRRRAGEGEAARGRVQVAGLCPARTGLPGRPAGSPARHVDRGTR